MSVKVSIISPHSRTCAAVLLIKKLLKINKIKLNVEIIYHYNLLDKEDHNEPLAGVYIPERKSKIFINPDECKELDTASKEHFFYGYCDDYTIFGVTIHEFCHLLTTEVFPKMEKNYIEQFQVDRLYLNSYSDTDTDEEMIEAMTLYITNPLLLKLISEHHWTFFRKYFKSPLPTTTDKFYKIYKEYPLEIKEHLKEKWHIVYNIKKKKFEKILPSKEQMSVNKK